MTFHTDHFEAIGVTNQVTVTDSAALVPAVEIARRQLAELDRACSRFRDDSELSLVNRAGRGAASALLLQALGAATDVAVFTDGAVDPTVGRSLSAIGYDRDFELIARRGADWELEARPAVGWQAIRIDPRTGTVSVPRGCEIDLGASAKAFAADRLAAAILARTGSPVLVSLGGDIAVGGRPPAGGWPILVTDDSRAAGAEGQVVAIRAGGLATSSTTVRRWRAGRVEMHHIVDPRTGVSADGCWQTVSVTAATCLQANAAATAAIVLGARAPHWLRDRGLSGRLLGRDGTIETIGGWPEQPDMTQPAPGRRSTTEVPTP